jgi:hypothetical protein
MAYTVTVANLAGRSAFGPYDALPAVLTALDTFGVRTTLAALETVFADQRETRFKVTKRGVDSIVTVRAV